MKIHRNKIFSAIVLILMLTIVVPLFALPAANAHLPPWQIPTYAYVNVAPDIVGVGQRVFIVMWAYLRMPNAVIDNDIRMQNYMLNITKPDGKIEIRGPYTPDATQTTYTTYVPTVTGQYSVTFWYPNTVYRWNDTTAMRTWTNDTFLGATSEITYFNVQQEQLPPAKDSYPLPTEYWTRPIEGQNTYWAGISSNWLGSGSPQIGTQNMQTDGIAPNSPHIMWTKPIQDGGVAGGSNLGVSGNMIYTGSTYRHRFPNPIIMYGRLFYREPSDQTAQAGDTVAVDLRTGAEIWRRDDLPTLSFGYNYDGDTPNQHGVFGDGYLFSSNFGRAFDPRNGNPLFNVTNVPSGSAVLGPHGEVLRYNIANLGNTANQNYFMAQWNSSKLWNLAATSPTPNTATTSTVSTITETSTVNGSLQTTRYNVTTTTTAVNASLSNRFDWNVSIPWRNGMTGTVTVVNAFLGDILLGINGTLSTGDPSYIAYGGWSNASNPYTMWAVNLNASRGARGSLLWMKTFTPEPALAAVYIRPQTVDPVNRVFTMYMKETMDWYGYNLDTGDRIWGPYRDPRSFDTFAGSVDTENTGSHHIAYGNLYVSGYGGVLQAIDIKTGQLKWTYGNGGPGNSTYAGLESPWGYAPIFIAVMVDGKIILFTNEHSPNTPQYKDSLIRAVDAYTGKEIWTLTGWGQGGSFMSANGAVAEGFYTYLNTYDMQIYTIGKGPSSTAVSIQNDVISQGNSVLIKGMITDISEGTKQNEQAARFPNGVPAVSDASQGEWMDYVYMQKPRPTNTTGVNVMLSVNDPNGNNYPIGNATSDASGLYSLIWTPPVSGKYTVIATFPGSESYWPSFAETAIGVLAAPSASISPSPSPTQSAGPVATPTPVSTASSSPSPVPVPSQGTPTEIYIIAAAAIVIAVVVAVGAAIFRKRK